MRSILSVVFAAASFLPAVAVAASPPPAPVLVELFTSEGCSSCPPAETVLERLAREQPIAGVRVVAIGEHVDYWDGPEWRDRYASPEFSRRQQRYARVLPSSIYTPQAVIDGRRQVVGGDERSLRAAIVESARRPRGTVTLAADAGREPRTFRVDASWAGGVEADVYLATVEHGSTSAVTGGENAGRTLRHTPLARTLVKLGTGKGTFRGSFTAPADPAPGGAREVVVFVQQRGQGAVVATGVAPLPDA